MIDKGAISLLRARILATWLLPLQARDTEASKNHGTIIVAVVFFFFESRD